MLSPWTSSSKSVSRLVIRAAAGSRSRKHSTWRGLIRRPCRRKRTPARRRGPPSRGQVPGTGFGSGGRLGTAHDSPVRRGDDLNFDGRDSPLIARPASSTSATRAIRAIGRSDRSLCVPRSADTRGLAGFASRAPATRPELRLRPGRNHVCRTSDFGDRHACGSSCCLA